MREELVNIFDTLGINPFKDEYELKSLSELMDELSNEWLNLSDEEKTNFSLELLKDI